MGKKRVFHRFFFRIRRARSARSTFLGIFRSVLRAKAHAFEVFFRRGATVCAVLCCFGAFSGVAVSVALCNSGAVLFPACISVSKGYTFLATPRKPILFYQNFPLLPGPKFGGQWESVDLWVV